VLEGAAWRVEHEARLATTTAWLTAGFMRTKKLPALKKVLGSNEPRRPPERQSVEQQAAIIRALHARLGGELKVG
jgi:hypothetical protein